MSQPPETADVILPSGLGRRLPFGLMSLILLVFLASVVVILLMWLIQSPGQVMGSFQSSGGVRWWVIGAGVWLGLAAFSFLASWLTSRRRIQLEDGRVTVIEPFGGKRVFEGTDARSALITGTAHRFGQGDIDIEYSDGRKLRLDGTGFRAADLQKVAQLLLATPNTSELTAALPEPEPAAASLPAPEPAPTPQADTSAQEPTAPAAPTPDPDAAKEP